MKKPLAYLIACGLSVILWFFALYSCSGAPGAATPPGLSQNGTSKVFDPPPLLKNISNSQHKCFVQKWDQAETNPSIETITITATKWANAIEYSELGNIAQFNNLYYVKYELRFRILFGCDTAACDTCITDIYNKILVCHIWKQSHFGAYSQIGKFNSSADLQRIGCAVVIHGQAQ